TNSAIALSKGFGWLVTGSPTLFAETIHSIADVANQILLKVGEVRGRAGPDRMHPFGRGQEAFFWGLVSAVSVFFLGCGVNVYHGLQSLLSPVVVEPFTPLVLGLLLLALVLEDAVALFGIVLTLLVAGVSFAIGPHPEFDATVAIVVGLMLGAMALFLASLNRRLLIDTTDVPLDGVTAQFLAGRGMLADVSSIVLDAERSVIFIRVRPGHAPGQEAASYALGQALKVHARSALGRTIDAVYWKFPTGGAT